MEVKRLLLTSLNSKFIHSNLAIRYLKSSLKGIDIDIGLSEFTINDSLEAIRGEIYRERPDIIGLSTYIWNIEETLKLIEGLKDIMPDLTIILGGPEVSFDSKGILIDNPSIDIIVKGEGDISFPNLIKALLEDSPLEDIKGISYRYGEVIRENPDMDLVQDLESLDFPYAEGFDDLNNKIIYYETSRGCPFNCQYCLSSTIKGVRFLPLPRIEEDIRAFIDAKIPLVKLVDRTFNANPKRARDIFKLIMGLGGETSFHFEICADLLDDETIELLKDAREGLFQFEIGVQSTNHDTLGKIDRRTDLDKLFYYVGKLKELDNIHLHLDLIAGLPMENLSSFKESFNDVYGLKPHKLQLGFLKLLKGSGIREDREEHGYRFLSFSPYEFLSNNYMSYDEALELKDIEDIVERYPNTGRFNVSLGYLEKLYDNDYYELFKAFSSFWRSKGYFKYSHSLFSLYEYLLNFALEQDGLDKDLFKELLRYDYAHFQRPSRYPKGLYPKDDYRSFVRGFYKDEEKEPSYLKSYEGLTASQMSRKVHIGFFSPRAFEFIKPYIDDKVRLIEAKDNKDGMLPLLFDYNN